MPRTLTRIDKYSISEQEVINTLKEKFNLPDDGIWNFSEMNLKPTNVNPEPIKKVVYTVTESIE